jgi:ribonuclease BN (tRNA processing enzyme)
MRIPKKLTSAAVCALMSFLTGNIVFASAECPGHVSVEVLGSGGPLADDERASTGYLVWIDAKARLLIDAGGGTFLRFAESGAQVSDLKGILISHFHADHVSDLPSILKSGSFERGATRVTVIGPSRSDKFPGLNEFLGLLFDPDSGAFRYLSDYAGGPENPGALEPIEVNVASVTSTSFDLGGGITVSAIPVIHGEVPALAFLVTIDGKTTVFAGDQSEFSEYFEESLAGTEPDLLIAHHAIREGAGQPRGLHRDPYSIGELAARMKAGRLVLSHNMKRALDDLSHGLPAIREGYDGPVNVASDHGCFIVSP